MHDQESEMDARRGQTAALIDVLGDCLRFAAAGADFLSIDDNSQVANKSRLDLAALLYEQLSKGNSIFEDWYTTRYFKRGDEAGKFLLMCGSEEDEDGALYMEPEDPSFPRVRTCYVVKDGIARYITLDKANEFRRAMCMPVENEDAREEVNHA